MKKLFFPIAILFFTTGNIFIGCQSSAAKVEDARQNVNDAQQNVSDAQAKLDQAKKDSVSEYEKAKVEWNVQIAQDEQDMANYEAMIAKEKKTEKTTDEARLDKLQKREADLKATMNDYKEDASESWKNFETRMDKSADEFSNDLSDLGKSLKKDFTPASKKK